MSGLFNSTVLDVAIGLVFVYLLLAIICTAINELIARTLRSRGKLLLKGIQQLLDNQPVKEGADPNGFLNSFYTHPLISNLMDGDRHPTYIAARTFADTLIHMLTPGNAASITYQGLEGGINALPPGDVKNALTALLRGANGDLNKAETAIEVWYDDAMSCVSGWYKRHIQAITLVVAILLTVLANGDTIGVTKRLWQNPVQRATVITASTAAAQAGSPALSSDDQNLLGELLGWNGSQLTPSGSGGEIAMIWILRLLGWTLTVFAISLGAPFWFDLLSKFMNIRSSGPPPASKAQST
jgi:hypothetical protein